jgi:ribosomal protein L33
MQATITLICSLSQPLFTIDQRTQQGKIIGINYSTQKNRHSLRSNSKLSIQNSKLLSYSSILNFEF